MSVSTGEWIGIGIGAAILLIVIGYLIYKHIEKKNNERIENERAINLTNAEWKAGRSPEAVAGRRRALIDSSVARDKEFEKSNLDATINNPSWKYRSESYLQNVADTANISSPVRVPASTPKPRKKSKEKKVSKKKAKK